MDDVFHDEDNDQEREEQMLERWGPVGACELDCNQIYYDHKEYGESERLQRLEEEQDQLNSSLIALTTHFAQVQFRLKQIVDATPDEKESLLKELEEFAFRGIPDIRDYVTDLQLTQAVTEKEHEEKLAQQRIKQKELISKLKEQLEDLEQYAYETGEAGMPQSMILERQSVIIEQLKGKLPIDLDTLEKMSPDELRMQVDQAIRELVNPVKMKEQLVAQLKTQISDLERFIEFLQGKGDNRENIHCTCNCPVHNKKSLSVIDSSDYASECCAPPYRQKKQLHDTEDRRNNGTAVKIVRRALTILQMFAITQFGCGSQSFERNLLKKTSKGAHWGDLRAQLEIAINQVIELVSNQEPPFEDSDYTSDSEDAPVILCNEKLTTAIRKDLSAAIRDIMQHGLMPVGQSSSLVPLGCFSTRSASATRNMHAWDLIIEYYSLKNGRQYNSSPARKLSQSFNLDIVGGVAITPKQTLLGAIDNIITTHTPLKRSADSHFKAFVSAALNEKKLVSWLRLIFKTKILIDRYYQPWSYVSRTGFEDGLKSLDRLNQYEFDLPVDLAVRQLQNIRDAF